MTNLAGTFPVLPTVFDDTGRIDDRGMVNVIEWVIGCGSDGVAREDSPSTSPAPSQRISMRSTLARYRRATNALLVVPPL